MYKQWPKRSFDDAIALALPHISTGTIFVPKGTLCLTILWNCHNNPSTYGDDAAVFRPGWLLDVRGEIISGPAETREEGNSTFGFGRHAFVGKHIAKESLVTVHSHGAMVGDPRTAPWSRWEESAS
ncbi:hypothetical protein H4582DRAFT_2015804 [Lactarius indigo]|nr:hypothetical protein H4582DRAFT_2015804 [Lactarius indigo]